MADKYLITGATGFLGSAIVAELIEQGRLDQVMMLVRADSIPEAQQRIVTQLEKLNIPNAQQLIQPRHILLGDLNSSDWLTHPAVSQITKIINSAAIASFGNNPDIWKVNVDHTLQFAKHAATLPNLKRFVHIGTGMACGIQATSPVSESYDVGADALHLVPYTQSKAEIERLIREQLPELPFVVARPSIIVGHSRYGVTPSASIFWVFRMGHLLREFLCNYDDKIDVIPVDWAAQSIVKLADLPTLQHQKYHISAGPDRSCTFRDIDNRMSSYEHGKAGCDFKKVDFEHLYSRREEFPTLFGSMEEKVILKAIKLYGGFSLLNFLFDNKNIQDEGIAPPPSFTDYVDQCMATSKGVTVAEQMMVDFK